MRIYRKRSWRDWLRGFTDDHFFLATLCIVLVVLVDFIGSYALDVQSNFITLGCDTAFFQSALANSLNGHFFRDTAFDGPNILGIHSSFSILILLPIYAYSPEANTLFEMQIIGVYSTLIPLYLIGCKVLNNPKHAFILTGSVIPNGLLYAMATGPFHLETWISAAALWSYYGYLRNNILLVVLSMLFAFGCGEQSAFIFLAMGIMIFWKPYYLETRHFGTIFVGSALGWIVFAFFIMPLLFRDPSQQNIFALNFSNWKIQSPLELPWKVLLSPLEALADLLSTSRWSYIIGLSGFPIFLTAFFLRSWPMLLPFPLYFLMSTDQFYYNIHVYYFQFAFLAGLIALLELLQRFDLLSKMGMLAMTATYASNLMCGSIYYANLMNGCFSDDPFNQKLHDVFESLPINDAVFCPHRYSAYLSNHPDMVMGDLREENIDFDKMVEDRFNSTQVHAADIQYLFVDFLTDQTGPRSEGPELKSKKIREDNVAVLLKSGEWEQVWSENDVVLLHRIKGPSN